MRLGGLESEPLWKQMAQAHIESQKAAEAEVAEILVPPDLLLQALERRHVHKCKSFLQSGRLPSTEF